MLGTHHIKDMIARLMAWDETLTREEARAIVARHGDRPAIKDGMVHATRGDQPLLIPVNVFFKQP